MNLALILPIAAKLGLPVLTRILARHGGEAGGVAAEVIKDIAAALGVAPTPEAVKEAYEMNPKAGAEALARAERDNADAWIDMTESALKGQFQLLAAEQASGGWKDGWRPAGMYLIGFLWAWAFVILPLANAAFKAAIAAPDLAVLSWLTSVYMALYMGGHTVKDMAEKARDALAGRKS